MGYYDLEQPAYLHVDEDTEYLAVTLVQGSGGDRKVCAMATRAMTPTEKSCPRMERLLIAAAWGVKRFQRCCFYVHKLVIVLPSRVDLVIANGKQAPPRLMARIIELDSMGCTYEVGQGAWQLNEELQRLGKLEGSQVEKKLRQKTLLKKGT